MHAADSTNRRSPENRNQNEFPSPRLWSLFGFGSLGVSRAPYHPHIALGSLERSDLWQDMAEQHACDHQVDHGNIYGNPEWLWE